MSITSQVLLLFIWYVWWVHRRSELNSSFSIQLVWHMYRCPWMPNMIAPADPSKIRWFIIRFWLSRRAFYQAVLFTLSMLVSRRRRIEEGDEQDCAAQGMNEAVEAVEAFMCTVLATGMKDDFSSRCYLFFFAWSTFWCFLHVSIMPPYLWTLLSIVRPGMFRDASFVNSWIDLILDCSANHNTRFAMLMFLSESYVVSCCIIIIMLRKTCYNHMLYQIVTGFPQHPAIFGWWSGISANVRSDLPSACPWWKPHLGAAIRSWPIDIYWLYKAIRSFSNAIKCVSTCLNQTRDLKNGILARGAWGGINLPRGCERSQFYAWLRPFGTIAILIERWLKTMLSLDWSRLVSFLQPLPLSHRDESNWLVGFQSAKKVKSHCTTVDDTCSYATSCIFHFLFSSQDILSFFIFFHLPWRLQHFYKVHELDIATREALKQAARDATAWSCRMSQLWFPIIVE